VKLHVDRSGAVAFACESFLASHPDERPRVVSLQCTARLDESILVDAVLSGASSVAVINASCGTCPQCSLCKLTQTMVVVANHLLECWQYPAAITLTQKIPDQIEPLPITEGEATGVTRRSFFTAFKGGGARFASQMLPGVVAVAIGRRSQNPNALPSLKDQPKVVPEKWRLLFNSLKKLKAAPQTPEFESKIWGEITVNANCNGCGGCSDICPSAAIMSIEQDGLWALFFEGSRCTQCGLCRDVCFQEGIELSPRIRLAPMLAQTPRMLKAKKQKEVDDLLEPMEERMARLFNCQVTA
jgi:ferredoxin